MASTPKASAHHGRRLRKLLRPNGRRVHIAASPEEHDRLRRDLAKVEPDEDFDVYIHGSDEHVKYHHDYSPKEALIQALDGSGS